MKPNPPTADARRRQLHVCIRHGLQLIPGRLPGALMPDGSPAGKIPRKGYAQSWSTDRFDSTVVATVCVRKGWNVHTRPRARELVIDIDPRNGGEDSLIALCLDIGDALDNAPSVITGGDPAGCHLFFHLPLGVRIHKQLAAYPGLDFLSVGTQTVAAGSVHPTTGNMYVWDADTFQRPRPMAPDALIDLLRKPEQPAATTMRSGTGEWTNERLVEVLALIDAKQHAGYFDWLALAMSAHAVTDGQGFGEFLAWCETNPDAFTSEGEVMKHWNSFNAGKGYATGPLLRALEASRRPGAQDMAARIRGETVRLDAGDDFDEVEP